MNGSVPVDVGAVDSPATDTVGGLFGGVSVGFAAELWPTEGTFSSPYCAEAADCLPTAVAWAASTVGCRVAEPSERGERAEHEHCHRSAEREARGLVRPRLGRVRQPRPRW